MAGVLVVATIFIRLIVSTISQRRGELIIICETKLPMQELELKVQGAYARGGRNCGILRYRYVL